MGIDGDNTFGESDGSSNANVWPPRREDAVQGRHLGAAVFLLAVGVVLCHSAARAQADTQSKASQPVSQPSTKPAAGDTAGPTSPTSTGSGSTQPANYGLSEEDAKTLDAMAKVCELTAEQRRKILASYKTRDAEVKKINAAIAEIVAEDVEQQYNQLLDKWSGIESKLQNDIQALLTPKQKTQWAEYDTLKNEIEVQFKGLSLTNTQWDRIMDAYERLAKNSSMAPEDIGQKLATEIQTKILTQDQKIKYSANISLMATVCQLTSEQLAGICRLEDERANVIQDFYDKNISQRRQRNQLQNDMQEALKSGDENAAMAIAREMDELDAPHDKIVLIYDDKVQGVLTDPQKSKWRVYWVLQWTHIYWKVAPTKTQWDKIREIALKIAGDSGLSATDAEIHWKIETQVWATVLTHEQKVKYLTAPSWGRWADLAEACKLTAKQWDKICLLEDARAKALQDYRDRNAAAYRRLSKDQKQARLSGDQEVISAAQGQLEELSAPLKQIDGDFDRKVQSVLTVEQKAQWEKWQDRLQGTGKQWFNRR